MLCIEENYKINIILADPYREELKSLDSIEYKENFDHSVKNIEKYILNFCQ